MNIAKLNTVSLDDKTFIIKRGTSGGGTPDTPTPSKPKYTGHADAEGLRAIGWTDEDIAYYQENGVNWNEEDDEYHLVTDDNKALYGVLTASNISSYRDRIVYLPKIDTSGVTNLYNRFSACYALVAIPQLDISNVTYTDSMFNDCRSLTCIPLLDTSNVTGMDYMFSNCTSLVSIPQLDTAKVTKMSNMFSNCTSLVSIPQLDTAKVTNMSNMFAQCYSLVSVQLNNKNIMAGTSLSNIFKECYSLAYIHITNFGNAAIQFDYSPLLSKESLLYIINNEAATSAITIKLASYAYDRWATDVDVVAALANHPNISLAK